MQPSRKRRQRSPDVDDEDEREMWRGWAGGAPAPAPPDGEYDGGAGWMPPTPPRVPSPGCEKEMEKEMSRWCREGSSGMGVEEMGRSAGRPPITRVAVLPAPDTEGQSVLYTPWLRQLAHSGITAEHDKHTRGVVFVPRCSSQILADPLYAAVLESLQMGDYDDARTALEISLTMDVLAVETWLLLAHTEYLAGCDDGARSRLAAMRDELGSPEAWLLSADLELFLGDDKRATELLTQALDNFPLEPALWLLVGSVWERSGKVDEAREAYGRAIVSNCREPDEESLQAALARVGTCHGLTWLTLS